MSRRIRSGVIRRPRSRVEDTIYDSFVRANSTAWLGVADSGQAWGNDVNPFSIASNLAVPSSGGNLNVAWIDAQSGDVYIRTTMKVGSGNGGGVALRTLETSLNAGSWIEIQLLSAGTSFRMMRVPAFANIVTPATVSKTVGSNVVIEVWAVGSSITAALDGTVLLTGTETQNQTVPKHGLYAEDTSVSFSDFLMKPI